MSGNELTPMKTVIAVVGAETARRKRTRADRANAVMDQRRMYQTAGHIEEVLSRLFDFRDFADVQQRLDDRQDLTEAVFHLLRARAYLDRVSQRRYMRRASELEAYK